MLSPLFIIGCARSGTSILGEFFENNSQCKYYFDEDIWDTSFSNPIKKTRTKLIRNTKLSANKPLREVFQKISDSFSNSNKDEGQRLTENDVAEEHMNNIKKLVSTFSKKRLIIHGPKHSLRILFIKKLFPDATFLHIIRDGRDVTCSLKRGMEDSLWVHHKPPGWKKWEKKPTLEKCAWLWNETINIINSDKEKIPSEDFLEIRYEDLVKEPEKTMRQIFGKLEIPFEKHQEDLCKKVQNEMTGSFEATPGWTTKNHSKRIGRYKENLTNEELIEVEKIVGTNNERIQNI